jgi:hypothetical protein
MFAFFAKETLRKVPALKNWLIFDFQKNELL